MDNWCTRTCALLVGVVCFVGPTQASVAVAGPAPAPIEPAPPPSLAPSADQATAAPPSAAPEPGVVPAPDAPAPEPVVAPEPAATPAPEAAPEAEVVPAPAPVLDETPVRSVEPQVEGVRPAPGVGQVVGGGILVGTGALNILGGALLLATKDAAPSREVRDALDAAGKAGLIIGSIYAVGGAVLLVTGTRARKKYREWAHRNRLSPPKPGNGMLVGGGILTAAGALDIAITSGTRTATPLSYTLDGLQIGAGVALLVVGGLRRAKYNRWLTQRGLTWSPTLAPNRRGATAGISGRF